MKRQRLLWSTGRAPDREPLFSTTALVKVMGIVVIPATAGVLLLFLDPALVALVTVALYGSLWLLFNPFPALLLYLLLVAVRPQEGIAQLEAIHVERLFAVLAILGWGLQAGVRRAPVTFSRGVAGWLVAYVVVCFCSIFTSLWKLAAVDAWIELLKAVVLFFLISQLVDSPRRLIVILAVFALGHLWMAGESIRLYYSEGYDYMRMGILRATTSSVSRGDPNSLAASLLLAVCLGIYTIRSRAGVFWRLMWFCVICAGGFVVVLTGSRAAMSAALFMLFYVWLRSRKKLVVAACAVIVVAGVWLAMPLQYKDRFMTTFDFERNPSAGESARGRITGLRVGAQMFLDRPLLGVGVGNFSVAHAMRYSSPDYRSWLQAHNLLAQVAGETGLLGVIAFAGFVIASMRLAGRLSTPPRPVPVVRSNGGAVSRANPPPGAAPLTGSDDASFIGSVARASLASFWLLLFLGLFSHNVMRFNWYVNAGLVSACAVILPSILTKPGSEPPLKA
jgi:O-antigen ligase